MLSGDSALKGAKGLISDRATAISSNCAYCIFNDHLLCTPTKAAQSAHMHAIYYFVLEPLMLAILVCCSAVMLIPSASNSVLRFTLHTGGTMTLW